MSDRAAVRVGRLAICALLASLLAVTVISVVFARGVPLTGRQTLVIDGSSMEPGIPLGAAVLVTPVSAGDLDVGDVVSLRNGPRQAVFTHRITRIVGRGADTLFETKGDANRDPDPALSPASSIVGRVDWSLPMLGFLLAYLSLPSGMLFVLCLGATLIVALLVLDEVEAELAEELAADPREPGRTAGGVGRDALPGGA